MSPAFTPVTPLELDTVNDGAAVIASVSDPVSLLVLSDTLFTRLSAPAATGLSTTTTNVKVLLPPPPAIVPVFRVHVLPAACPSEHPAENQAVYPW